MNSIEKDLYDDAFRQWDMASSNDMRGYGPEGVLHTFDNEFGTGEYWAYFRENLFAVNALKMRFSKGWDMSYPCTEHLTLSCYDQVKGMVQHRGEPLVPGAIAVYLGTREDAYRAHFSNGAVVQATSIAITPDYYCDYLQKRFGVIENVRDAFACIDGRRDLPEIADLLRKARAFQGRGTAAKLFYEGVVAEAIALVMSASEKGARPAQHISLTDEDLRTIRQARRYIVRNLAGDLTCARLASELHIGQTKLKALFKAAVGAPPSCYVTHERMEEASRLLEQTTLPIAEVGRAVGYRKPGAFTEAFQREKGQTPSRFRQTKHASMPRA